jgi:hypothetical protein
MYVFKYLGRTLDIEYNLSSIMNAIKTNEQQNQTSVKSLPTATATMNTRRRHTYIGTVTGTSESDVSSWKQNAAQSQVCTITSQLIDTIMTILDENSRTFDSIDVHLW